jgi:amino acid transporter
VEDGAKGLMGNVLGLFDNTVIGVASTAPAYSLATGLGAIVAAVGLFGPAEFVDNFVPMLGVAIAFFFLNRYYGPNAGGCFTWVSDVMQRHLGYLTGWAIIAADVVFMIGGSVPAGTYTLDLVNPSLANNALLVSVVAAAWFVVVTAIVTRGISITAKFQWVLLLVEYVTLIGFSVLALVRVYTLHPPGSHPVAGSWFVFHGNAATFAAGATAAIFFYWGFDTITNLGEESKDATANPGQASILSTVFLLFVYLLVAVSVQALLPPSVIHKNAADILDYVAGELAPRPWSDLMILAVISSTVATLETTLLPTARVSYDMARQGVFPKLFAAVHPLWRTPWLGTLVIGAVSFAGIFLVNLSASVGTFINNAVLNVGVLVAYYYGITAIASAWYMRPRAREVKTLLFGIVLPLLSGLFLFTIGFLVIQQDGLGSALPAVVSLALGVPLLVYYRAVRPGWFRRPTVTLAAQEAARAD